MVGLLQNAPVAMKQLIEFMMKTKLLVYVKAVMMMD